MNMVSHLSQYLAEFFLEWEVSQIQVVRKIKIHFYAQRLFFRKSCRFWDNVEKYGGARETADGNTAASCMLN
jgi:hypothetical protein